MSVGTACGKIILFGEHAVVYGRPALAVPFSELRASVTVKARTGQGIVIRARDLGREILVGDAARDDALAAITRLTLDKLGKSDNLELEVSSEIPLASGFGSGAAISTAIVRALASYFNSSLTPDEISTLVFETEKLYHGTPSGIDNTVIAYEQAIRFVRRPIGEHEILPIHIARPFTLLIADTGIASPTKVTVGDVRQGWERDPERYERVFDAIGAIVSEAQDALAHGENAQLGELMRRNHQALRALGVSSDEIERLIAAGSRAGASGAKLSGGGRGGNVLFFVEADEANVVRAAVLRAGAARVIVTVIGEKA